MRDEDDTNDEDDTDDDSAYEQATALHVQGIGGTLKVLSMYNALYTVDPTSPEAGGNPHFSNEAGKHLYTMANGAWCMGPSSTPSATTATAITAGGRPVPKGSTPWKFNVHQSKYPKSIQRIALHSAALLDRPTSIPQLVKVGARVNASDLIGLTPLHLASSISAISSMRALVAHKAIVATHQPTMASLHYIWQPKHAMCPVQLLNC
jgi:hypothetical protein